MYQPVLPAGGLLGWRFLERTLETQQTAFSESAGNRLNLDYFKERIGEVRTAEELVNDRRLLTVALAAFELSDDINAKYFIRRVLEDGTTDPDALSNRLADKRYREFSEAFGFGDVGLPSTLLPGFAERIEERFTERSFEVAVGEQSESLRLALNGKRALPEIAADSNSDRTAWFTVMGTPPLRTMLEGALALPQSVGTLDLDRQLEEFQNRAQQVFGVSTVEELASDETIDRVVERYLLLAGNDAAAATSPALVILRGF